MNKSNHPYHMVSISPWPLILSINIMLFLISLIKWFYFMSTNLMIMSSISLILTLIQWWRDIIRESTFQGMHTSYTMKNLKLSMILFITSEIFFFISLFWAYFHSSLSPSIEIGMMWPPKNIIMFNPYDIPLLNSIILITSGITITWSHNSLLNKKNKMAFFTLLYTIYLSFMFTMCQYFEYKSASFTIADSIFGSIFFMTTGFHGIHVIIGTIFLIVCMFRMIFNHFSSYHHFGFEAAIWYWHFVDIVWLFVYTWLYWWSF
uniref:Cytochrome c oxidase subunit 3 n=1 Tax=Vespa magnifica TaxID=202807 RepID=A0A6M8P230_VESMG|nr:cytochrome c oxidase subunit III [Vespa magnifica]QKG04159.1 cytochrome c oxidase subunit 3 [Vespa magnifica]UQW19831.1 cytochrome c oxidase subunit 3 [Vespa magnifica]WHL55432.1 cytochrome c oxidase subunit 3 [Vespa magnifica]